MRIATIVNTEKPLKNLLNRLRSILSVKIHTVIKLITLAELARFQKNFYYKRHEHIEENVFLFNGEKDILKTRAYRLCKLCGQMSPLTINKEIAKEIKDIMDKKI